MISYNSRALESYAAQREKELREKIAALSTPEAPPTIWKRRPVVAGGIHVQLVDAGEIARVFGVGRSTVLNWNREGSIPPAYTLGGSNAKGRGRRTMLWNIAEIMHQQECRRMMVV